VFFKQQVEVERDDVAVVCQVRQPRPDKAAHRLRLELDALPRHAVCPFSPWRSFARLAAAGSMRASGAAQPRTRLAVFCAHASVLATATRRTRYLTRAARPRTGWSCRLRGGVGAAPHELFVTRPCGAGLALVVRAARHP
jgi:hypothetical protein